MSVYSDLQHQNPKWKTSSTTNQQWSTRREAAVMSEACDRSCWQHPLCKHTKVWQLGLFPLSNLLPLCILLWTRKDVFISYSIQLMHYWSCSSLHHFWLGRKHSRSRPRKNSGWAWSDCKWYIRIYIYNYIYTYMYIHTISIESWNTMYFMDF